MDQSKTESPKATPPTPPSTPKNKNLTVWIVAGAIMVVAGLLFGGKLLWDNHTKQQDTAEQRTASSEQTKAKPEPSQEKTKETTQHDKDKAEADSLSSAQLAEKIAEREKSAITLPLVQNGEFGTTTLVDIKAVDGAVQYLSTLNSDNETFSNESFYQKFKPVICASAKEPLKRGVSYYFLYSVENSSKEYSATIAQKDCE